MAKEYKYYLGRITKGGVLTTEDLIDAIIAPVTIEKRLYNYTFTNVIYNEEQNYIYGRLAKYTLEGEIETIIPHKHVESSISVEHIKESSSPFLISLDHMGIAYPQVWNHLPKEQFEKTFNKLISQKYENFFVACNIEPIVDLRTFIDRVSLLTRIDKITATVVPPNPLFGPVWKDLKNYMEERKSSEIQISEKSKYLYGLKSKIKEILKYFTEDDKIKKEDTVKMIENLKYDITDAAILMAADGYGTAKIEGYQDKEEVIIKTKDNQKSFQYNKDPDIEEFYKIVFAEFEYINSERYLKH